MQAYVKRMIQDAMRKRGYLVSKYPSVPFKPPSVFDLAVQLLMSTRGPNCTFVEVGANNGRYGDPIFRYACEFPWRGILIEPQPAVFSKLRETYDKCKDRLIFENVAISQQMSQLTMYRARSGTVQDEVYASSVVSTDAARVAAQLKISTAQLEPFTVPCMSLNALLEKHRWRTFDILMVDTEGNDLEVLESIDLDRFQPKVIQFEHGHLSPKKIDRAIAHLSNSGYQTLFGGYQMDSVAIHHGFNEMTVSARPALAV